MKGKMIFAAAAILCGATAFGTGYYKPADETDLRWDRLDSWYQDATFTTAATHLPYSNEDVYVSAPYKVTITNGTIAGAHSMYLPSSGSGPAEEPRHHRHVAAGSLHGRRDVGQRFQGGGVRDGPAVSPLRGVQA